MLGNDELAKPGAESGMPVWKGSILKSPSHDVLEQAKWSRWWIGQWSMIMRSVEEDGESPVKHKGFFISLIVWLACVTGKCWNLSTKTPQPPQLLFHLGLKSSNSVVQPSLWLQTQNNRANQIWTQSSERWAPAARTCKPKHQSTLYKNVSYRYGLSIHKWHYRHCNWIIN